MAKEQKRLGELRDQLMKALLAAIPDATVNGSMARRLAGNLNITFPGVESEALMIALRSELAVSSGSACTTAAVLPSHVLKSIGLSDAQSHSTIRFGLGRPNYQHDMTQIGKLISAEVQRLKQF